MSIVCGDVYTAGPADGRAGTAACRNLQFRATATCAADGARATGSAATGAASRAAAKSDAGNGSLCRPGNASRDFGADAANSAVHFGAD